MKSTRRNKMDTWLLRGHSDSTGIDLICLLVTNVMAPMANYSIAYISIIMEYLPDWITIDKVT